MLKWLRFDMAFNVALLEVRFGFEVPKIRNNEEQLIYHTELIYTFRCLPVGCAFFPSFFSNCKLQSSKKHFVKMQFASLCAPFPGCWIFLNQHRLTCALFGTAVWIPWLFKHRLWIGMKWVWRTLPLLPTSCVWPPDNHRPPSHLHPPHPPRQGCLWWEHRRKLLGVTDHWGGVTASTGRVLRTCEPWMSLFHMALACRVTGNFAMMAVIAHTVVWGGWPKHTAHLREKMR